MEPDGYAPAARALLSPLGEVVEEPLTRSQLIAALPEVDVLIVRLGHRLDRELLAAGARLRAVVSATTGLDHIDLDYATEKGIQVLSLRGETEFLRGVTATAEHSWALLLSLIRRVGPATASVLRGEWRRDDFRGHQLAGRRLGIVGLGRLGSQVAQYGMAFRMSVAAFDPQADRWVEGVERVDSLGGLLAQSDVLSLHLPLNNNTRGLINAAAFGHLPAGALLINTSRGAIVREDALLAALRSGRLGGAGLDVLAEETELALRASPLISYAAQHENLLITPHLGGATYESMEATEIFMARKLTAFFSGDGGNRSGNGA